MLTFSLFLLLTGRKSCRHQLLTTLCSAQVFVRFWQQRHAIPYLLCVSVWPNPHLHSFSSHRFQDFGAAPVDKPLGSSAPRTHGTYGRAWTGFVVPHGIRSTARFVHRLSFLYDVAVASIINSTRAPMGQENEVIFSCRLQRRLANCIRVQAVILVAFHIRQCCSCFLGRTQE